MGMDWSRLAQLMGENLRAVTIKISVTSVESVIDLRKLISLLP